MKRIFTILFVTVSVALSPVVFGQNSLQEEITWTASADRDMLTNELFPVAMSFVSFEDDKIEMRIQNSVQIFQIQLVNGQWTDISQPGSLAYDILLNSQPGRLEIRRDATGIFIVLDMRESAPDGIFREYTIDSFQLNN
jgi:hypothetical protein